MNNPKDIRRKIPPEIYLRRERRKFIASPVCSNEYHWFEAEYGLSGYFQNLGIWELIPGTLQDLGPVADNDDKINPAR